MQPKELIKHYIAGKCKKCIFHCNIDNDQLFKYKEMQIDK